MNSASTTKRGRPPSATLAEAFPDLAAQLVDPSLAQTLSKGSSRRVEWQCAAGHRWTTKVYNRTNAKNRTGCPVCSGKKVIPGVNDVATTHPEVSALFADQTLTAQRTAFSNTPVLLRCLTDPQHEWSAPPARIASGAGGCPYCSGRRAIPRINDLATTHPDIAAQLVDPAVGHQVKAGSSRAVRWRCPAAPEHIWSASPHSRTARHEGCPFCSRHRVTIGVTDLATTHPEIAKTMLDPSQATTLSAGSDMIVEWVCSADSSHIWSTQVYNRMRSGCPVCDNKVVLPGFNDLATTHPQLAAELLDMDQATAVTAGSSIPLAWQCQNHAEHTWFAPVSRRTGTQPTGCPRCRGPLPSRGEQELADLVRILVGPDQVLTSDRTTLPGRHELDIVVPARRIAIEFNGVYWHSDQSGKPATFHRDKSRLAADAGYQLLHIWEDDWIHRRHTVLRAIAHKLHAINRLPAVIANPDPKIMDRIYARALHPQEARGAKAAMFLDRHHMQGSVVATRHIVLCDDDGDIRAMLSLRSPRSTARMKRAHGTWEIQRYATRGVIPGGFSRLLAIAERTLLSEGVDLTRWVSFSSHDVSRGGMYEKAGFTADAELPPDYKYVGGSTGWRREPKEKYQRKRFRDDPQLLWDDAWTEREAALANKLHRVYDAGKTRWVKNVAA